MKRAYYPILIFSIAFTSIAAQRAITDTGENIILNSNHTWEYCNNSKKEAVVAIKTNPIKFNKTKDSTFMLKSTRNDSTFWVNPQKWTFMKPDSLRNENDFIEYKIKFKDRDIFGIAITEGIRVPLDKLSDITLNNAKIKTPGTKLLKQEYRTVNGNKVLYIEMSTSPGGINLNTFGYYTSNISGTTQLVVVTSPNLAQKYKSEINNFLNGLATQQKT